MLLDKVKLALRISHNLLDDEIEDTISAARSEMIRAGVPAEVASRDTSLTMQAIKTYCKATLAGDDKLRDGYQKAWESQLENLRKSTFGRC